jgi:hypothetical protein
VQAWAAYKHGLNGYFYWHGDHWQHNAQMAVGDRNQNVWLNPITFDNRTQPNKADLGFLDGDGVLFYPGQEVIHPDQDRGVPGPIASIQLANLRRGLQDHAYLTLAHQKGFDSVVNAQITQIVPSVFSQAGASVSFPEHGDDYEKARRALAEAIAPFK